MLKSVKDEGCIFMLNDANDIVGLVVDDGIKEVRFGFAKSLSEYIGSSRININLENASGSFPDVTTLRFSSKVNSINIKNEMFPNVRTIKSDAYYFRAVNGMLVKGTRLVNAFCKTKGEKIDFEEINGVSSGALSGCEQCRLTHFENKVFYKESFEGALTDKRNGIEMFGPVVVSADKTDNVIKIPSETQAITRNAFDFDAKIEIQSLKQLKMLYGVDNIKELTINTKKPLTLDAIETFDFLSNLKNLDTLRISDNNPSCKVIDNILYTKDGKTLIACLKNKKGIVKVPEGTVRIRASAFKSCANITELYFPDSLKYVGTDVCTNMTGLKKVDIGHGLRNFGSNMFRKCEALKEVVMHEQILSIGHAAFNECTELSHIELNEGLEIIGQFAFAYTNIKGITIPPSVNTICGQALIGIDDVYINRSINNPMGLLFSVSNTDSLSRSESGNHVITIHDMLTGQDYYVPAYFEKTNEIQFVSDLFDFESVYELNQTFILDYVHNRAEFMMLCMFYKFGYKNKKICNLITDFLKSWDFVSTYLKISISKNSMTDCFVMFMLDDLIPKNTLKEFLKYAQDNSDVKLASYVMDALGRQIDKKEAEREMKV